MIDVSKANQIVADVANIPDGSKRSDIVFAEILCCEGDFAAGKLANGNYAAVWKNSVAVADTKESLTTSFLNQHENTLLAYEVKK